MAQSTWAFAAVAFWAAAALSHGFQLPVAGPSAAYKIPACSRSPASRSAFARMSDEAGTEVAAAPVEDAVQAVAEAEEVSDAEARALAKTHTNKRKRNSRPEPTVQLEDLEVGSTVQGVVRNILSYGAFVDIGAPKDGMLHVSDISNAFVANISDVLTVGQTVSARIKSVDAGAGRFALIMKDEAAAAQPERRNGAKRPQRGKPDLSGLANYDPKQMIKGKVVSIMDFGCFVSISDSADGLVHISQLQQGRTESVTDVVSVGDEVEVRILGVDMDRQRVSLSMLPYVEPSEDKPQENGARQPRQRRVRDDDAPAFENTGTFEGMRATMDEEEDDAPTLFEHAWVEAQQQAAAKGISLPAELTE